MTGLLGVGRWKGLQRKCSRMSTRMEEESKENGGTLGLCTAWFDEWIKFVEKTKTLHTAKIFEGPKSVDVDTPLSLQIKQ